MAKYKFILWGGVGVFKMYILLTGQHVKLDIDEIENLTLVYFITWEPFWWGGGGISCHGNQTDRVLVCVYFPWFVFD